MKTIREILVNSLPNTDKEFKEFFSLFNTEQKRKNILLELTGAKMVKNSILKKPQYFEDGLVYVFNAAIRLKKIPKPLVILAWKGYKKVRDTDIRYCLLHFYNDITKDRNLWEVMFLAYTSLDGLDAFND